MNDKFDKKPGGENDFLSQFQAIVERAEAEVQSEAIETKREVLSAEGTLEELSAEEIASSKRKEQEEAAKKEAGEEGEGQELEVHETKGFRIHLNKWQAIAAGCIVLTLVGIAIPYLPTAYRAIHGSGIDLPVGNGEGSGGMALFDTVAKTAGSGELKTKALKDMTRDVSVKEVKDAVKGLLSNDKEKETPSEDGFDSELDQLDSEVVSSLVMPIDPVDAEQVKVTKKEVKEEELASEAYRTLRELDHILKWYGVIPKKPKLRACAGESV